MSKILVLMGKSASGKDMVKNELVNKYGFHSITTYTSRPMRDGEIPDVTYHYITNGEFLKRIEEDFFAEWKSYIVNGEIWYYGTAKEDIENTVENTVIILTPDGVRDIKNNGIDATVIYLYANLSTIKKRLKLRNDKNDKAEDRIKRDLKDFKDAESLADKLVYNNIDADIETVVKNVIDQYERKSK